MGEPIVRMQWMVTEAPDGAYLMNTAGYIATPHELSLIIDELIRFAKEHSDLIACNNAEMDERYERWQRGDYSDIPRRESRAKKRYVYMFKSGENKYKIGVSENVERRLKELNERPYPVELFAVSEKPFYRAFEVERFLHEIHEDDRISGEWFEINEECANLTACVVQSADDDFDDGRGE